MLSYYNAKFKATPCVSTDVSTPLCHTAQRLGYTVSFSETMVIIQRMGPFYCHVLTVLILSVSNLIVLLLFLNNDNN